MREYIRDLIDHGRDIEAFSLMRGYVTPSMSFAELGRWSELMALPVSRRSHAPGLRIALVGNATLAHLKEALHFHLELLGYAPEIFLGNFGAMDQEILNPKSGLYAFKPDLLWIFSTARDITSHIASPSESGSVLGDRESSELLRLRTRWLAFRQHSHAQIVQNNFDVPGVKIYGHNEQCITSAHTTLIQKINRNLSEENVPGLALFDYEWLSAMHGKRRWFSDRFWFHGKYPFDLDAHPLVAYNMAKYSEALLFKSKKCVVLDLDNTLWGGNVGDDGASGIQIGIGHPIAEAHLAFQNYILALKERGILIAACSKNDEDVAKAPFLHRSEMRIQLSDFSVFVANWNPKPDNMKWIAHELNIGMDAMVFVDDSELERNFMRQSLPEVAVPELGNDPSEYVRILDAYRYFETSNITADDKRRHEMYAQEARRKAGKAEALSLDNYLVSLKMRCRSFAINESNYKRTYQLFNKTNQFNMTGERITEAEVLRISESETIRSYQLWDVFGDYGVVAAIHLVYGDDVIKIKNWVISCRAFQRGLEDFIHNEVVNICHERQFRRIEVDVVDTGRNRLVSGSLDRLGYRLVKTWEAAGKMKAKWIFSFSANGGASARTFIEAIA